MVLPLRLRWRNVLEGGLVGFPGHHLPDTVWWLLVPKYPHGVLVSIEARSVLTILRTHSSTDLTL